MSDATHSFRFILEGKILDAVIIERLVAARCDDGLFGTERGVQVVEFDRQAVTFESAVLSALHDVESAVHGLAVVRVEPDELVTASGIAERTGRTRQNVAQHIVGERGPGGFPAPLTTADGRLRVWRWTDVLEWLGEGPQDAGLLNGRRSHFLAALNGALEMRRHLARYQSHGGEPSHTRTLLQLATESNGIGPTAQPSGLSQHAIEDCARSLGIRNRGHVEDRLQQLLEDAQLRNRSQIVFLANALLGQLSERTQADVELIDWLRDATSAHRGALHLRLIGDLSAAATLDQRVIERSAQVTWLIDHGPSCRAEIATPRRLSTFFDRLPFRREDELTCEWCGSPSTSYKLHGSIRPQPEALRKCLTVWTSHSEVDPGLTESVLSVLGSSLGMRRDIDAAPQLVRRLPRGAYPGFEDDLWYAIAYDYGDFEDLAPMASPAFGSQRTENEAEPLIAHWDEPDYLWDRPSEDAAPWVVTLDNKWQTAWPARVRRQSLATFHVASWTLARTLRTVVSRHLPERVGAVDDVVERIEIDLSDLFASEQRSAS